jgi:hypothetical protein
MGQKCKLTPGDVINRTYETVRLLGSGYSGEVWEVRHRFLPASFALKLMHAEDRDDAHKLSRFSAEASTLFHLQHENVVRVLDANETPEGLLFIVMELLQGETLTQRLTGGRIHPLRALKHAYDLACGLDAAHEIGVIHRDVKPDNAFITSDDTAKLLDFTAAKFSFAELRTTEPRNRVGTLAFMSPEHIHGTTSDARIDQYSLGMVIHTMLAGRHPFEHHFENQYALMKAQYEDVPEPLANVGLPAWMDELLAPALAKRIERRYSTMADFAREIREAARRLARDVRAGCLIVDVPLGEPPIDFEADPGERKARKTYLSPKPPAHQSTGPLLPSKKVTLAPGTLLEQGREPDDDADFDVAATAPLASRPRPPVTTEPLPPSTTAPFQSTTAPLRSMMTTAPFPGASRSRPWLALLTLVLALPTAAGLVWRWRTWRPAVATSAPAVPASPPPAPTLAEPSPTAEPNPPEESAAPPIASTRVPALPSSLPATVSVEARAKPASVARTKPTTALSVRPEPPLVSATPIPPPAPSAAPPPSSTAPHRMFGSED